MREGLSTEDKKQFDRLAGGRDAAAAILKPTGSITSWSAQALLDATGYCIGIEDPDVADCLQLSNFRRDCLKIDQAPMLDLDHQARALLRDPRIREGVSELSGRSIQTVQAYCSHNKTETLPHKVLNAIGYSTPSLRIRQIASPGFAQLTRLCFERATSKESYLRSRRLLFALFCPTPYKTRVAHNKYCADGIGGIALPTPAFEVCVGGFSLGSPWIPSFVSTLKDDFYIQWADYERFIASGRPKSDRAGKAIVLSLKEREPQKAHELLKQQLSKVKWRNLESRQGTEISYKQHSGIHFPRSTRVLDLSTLYDFYPGTDWDKSSNLWYCGDLRDIDRLIPLAESLFEHPATPESTAAVPQNSRTIPRFAHPQIPSSTTAAY